MSQTLGVTVSSVVELTISVKIGLPFLGSLKADLHCVREGECKGPDCGQGPDGDETVTHTSPLHKANRRDSGSLGVKTGRS